MIAVPLAGSASAVAFDNIEADAVYERAIKEQIKKEFSLGLEMLKAQADSLGMAVREKDVQALKQHMYDKAFLMGRCVDQAITFKKTVSEKILLDKYVKGCIEKYVKLMDPAKRPNLPTRSGLDTCGLRARTVGKDNRPYDFLGLNEIAPMVTDYVAMGECYERCRKKPDGSRIGSYLENMECGF